MKNNIIHEVSVIPESILIFSEITETNKFQSIKKVFNTRFFFSALNFCKCHEVSFQSNYQFSETGINR